MENIVYQKKGLKSYNLKCQENFYIDIFVYVIVDIMTTIEIDKDFTFIIKSKGFELNRGFFKWPNTHRNDCDMDDKRLAM